jgi:hypothetical protein
MQDDLQVGSDHDSNLSDTCIYMMAPTIPHVVLSQSVSDCQWVSTSDKNARKQMGASESEPLILMEGFSITADQYIELSRNHRSTISAW